MKVLLFFCGDLEEELSQKTQNKFFPMEFIVNWESQYIPVIKDEFDWYYLLDRSYFSNFNDELLRELEDMSFKTTVKFRKWTKINDELICKLYLSF